MTDIEAIEERTVYRIPEGDSFFEPYVGSESWGSEGAVIVDGDMVPVKQQAIPWCTTHGSNGRGPSPLGEACHYSALRQATKMIHPPIETCQFSDGGPEHKWWKDV